MERTKNKARKGKMETLRMSCSALVSQMDRITRGVAYPDDIVGQVCKWADCINIQSELWLCHGRDVWERLLDDEIKVFVADGARQKMI